MKTETMRPASSGQPHEARARVTRLARQVAFAEATVRDAAGRLVSRSTGTFLLHRDDEAGSQRGQPRGTVGPES